MTSETKPANGVDTPVISPFGSLGSIKATESREVQEMMKQVNDKGPHRRLAKTIIVIIVPIVTLMILCIVSLVENVNVLKRERITIAAIQSSNQYTGVVLQLMNERGLSAIFIGSDNTATEQVAQQLQHARASTDEAFLSLMVWPSNGLNSFSTIMELSKHVQQFRDTIDMRTNVTIDEGIRFYSTFTAAFSREAVYRSTAHDGNVWTEIVAQNSMLQSVDYLGIRRAIGGTRFAGCFLDDYLLSLFSEVTIKANMLMETAESYYGFVSTALEEELEQVYPAEDIVASMADTILENDNVCDLFGIDNVVEKSLYWYGNVSKIIESVSNVRNALSDQTKRKSQNNYDSANARVIALGTCVVIIVLVCLIMGVINARQIQNLLITIGKYAKTLQKKTLELRTEKKRTDHLLYQLLPRFVADQLRQGKPVEAEYFDSVTIYFSDIEGFTELAAMSTPMEVVHLLNTLYSTFDRILGDYYVYKVETIGDAYMVVSGLPERNEDHCYQIMCMASDLLNKVNEFVIPHKPQQRIRLRIGIHTGSCVAGVVGVKMPRYCLFGDTVNTASRMESTGEAMKIHISTATKTQFEDCESPIRQFHIAPRGTLEVKGKGRMETFWVHEMARNGLPPHHATFK